MAKRFGSHLEAIEWLKQNVLESESEKIDLVKPKLAHHLKIMIVDSKVKGVKRTIRYCQRCKVSWPCLAAQEEAIERGRVRGVRQHT
jgi:hypothetical protein